MNSGEGPPSIQWCEAGWLFAFMTKPARSLIESPRSRYSSVFLARIAQLIPTGSQLQQRKRSRCTAINRPPNYALAASQLPRNISTEDSTSVRTSTAMTA